MVPPRMPHASSPGRIERRQGRATGLRRRSLCLGLVALPLSAARAADGIALTISGYGLPFVPISVNGHSAVALVDTGSSHAVQISGRLQTEAAVRADALVGNSQRYDGTRSVMAGWATLALGPWHSARERVQMSAGDIERIADQVGAAFDAIVGWPLLSRFDFVIDYPGRRLLLEADDAAPGGWPVGLDAAKPLPVTVATIAGQEMPALIDSGAPTCNIDTGATNQPAGRLISLALSLGGRDLAIDFRVKDLAPIRQALSCRAVLGHNFLGLQALRYDRARHSFALG